MKYRKNEAEEYLEQFLKTKKWINECIICHSKGYKPDMPEYIIREESFFAYSIRHYFQPLTINDLGICLQCAKYLK